MKKRVLSMLLAFILCFSTLPMTAFAQEADAVTEQEEQQEAAPAAEPEEQQVAVPAAEQKEAEAAAAPGEETPSDKSTTVATSDTEDSTAGEAPDTVKSTGESISDNNAGTQDTSADDEKKAAVQKVQALIDALPETVTVENAESVSAQLEAIDEAMESLTEEQIAELDMTRLHAVSEAMNAPMTVPMTVAEGKHTDHPICGATCTDGDEHGPVTDWQPIGSETELKAATEGHYYLTQDIETTGTWKPNNNVVLCLNGHSIAANADADAITVPAGSSFTLTDCNSSGGEHYFTKNTEKNNLWEPVKTGGDTTVTGGVITHSSGKNGSGISMGAKGTFTMYGGTICGNYNDENSGAGVRATQSTIIMSGGAISGNVAAKHESGGGVYLNGNGGFFDMSGNAKITDNATTQYGGGVNVAGGTSGKVRFTMSGSAKITDNMCFGSSCGGAGVYASGGEFTMNGNAAISANRSQSERGSGGGVFVAAETTFTMNDDATISRNSAYIDSPDSYRKNSGGGVQVFGGTFIMNGGSIRDNMAESGAGVYVGESGSTLGTFTMNGGTITNNKVIKGNGGGVYVLGTFEIANGAQVLDNLRKDTSGQDTSNNVYLPSGKPILIGSEGLDRSAEIGVTMGQQLADGGQVTIAKGASNDYTLTADDLNAFSSDTGYKKYALDNAVNFSNGELHVHGICGKEVCSEAGHGNVAWIGVSKLDEITSAGYYYLKNDITLNDDWNPADGVVLCLNGNSIKAARSLKSISVNNTFTLTDCKGKDGSHYGQITNNTNISVLQSGNFYFYGGSITGNSFNTNLSTGVIVWGNFYMHGGEIVNNTTTGKGGGVYLDKTGRFTMTGGRIANNSAKEGGGVYVDSDTITVSSAAQITGNKVVSDDGEASNNVYLPNGKKITVDGALNDSASIGVTLEKLPVEGEFVKFAEAATGITLTDEIAGKFTIDNNSSNTYSVKNIDNSLYVVNGELHEHAICGTSCSHETKHDDVLWTPLTYNADTQKMMCGGTIVRSYKLTNGNIEYTLPTGNYYLLDNITFAGTIIISGNVNFCLNGKSITNSAQSASTFVIRTNGNLTVCDHEGGTITSTDKKSDGVQFDAYSNADTATFTMYGGTITGTGNGVYQSSGTGVFNMYGGAITDNKVGADIPAEVTMTVGGTARITGNTDMNVNLFEYDENSKSFINIDPSLTDAASISVATTHSPTAEVPIRIATGATGSVNYTKIFKPDKTDRGYMVIKDAQGDLYLSAHQHSWQYTLDADGKTITATCVNTTNCPNTVGGSMTIKAPEENTLIYDGSNKKATLENNLLTGEKDPTISYTVGNGQGATLPDGSYPTNVGAYTASITVGGVTASVTYKIQKADPAAKNFVFTAPGSLTYDGKAKTAGIKTATNITGMGDVMVKYYQGETEVQPMNAGEYKVKISVTDGTNFNAASDLTDENWAFTITPIITEPTVELSGNTTYTYTGERITPDVTVTIDGRPLTKGTDYTIIYGDNVNAGTNAGSVTVKAKGNYGFADVVKKFTIEEADPKLSFEKPTVTTSYGTNPANNTLTNKGDGEVTYQSSNNSVATVKENGEVTVVGVGETTITATAAKTMNYKVGTASYKLTVNKARVHIVQATVDNKDYDGSVNADVTGVVFANEADVRIDGLVAGTDYMVTGAFQSENAGEQDAEVTVELLGDFDSHYELTGGTYKTRATITAKPISIETALTQDRSYERNNTSVTILGVTFKDSTNTLVATLKSSDYTATGKMINANVGTDKEVTVTVTLQGNAADNYKLVSNTTTAKVAITQAMGGVLQEENLKQKFSDRKQKTFTPDYTGLPAGETWTYSISEAQTSGSAKVESVMINTAGKIAYRLTAGAENDTIRWTVTISNPNYKNFTKDLVLKLTAKDPQETLRITGDNTVAYGQKLQLSTVGGSGTGEITYSVDAGSTGDATIDENGILTPVKVGSVVITATKAGDVDYSEITSAFFVIMITQAATSGEPKYNKITTSGMTLADAGLTLTDSTIHPADGTLKWVDDAGNVLSDDTAVEVNKTYKWRFTPADTNYETLTGSIELYHVDAPAVTAQPKSVSVTVGDTATFEVAATGTAVIYQWQIDRNDGKGFVDITGATGAVYTTGVTDKDCDGFKYQCVIRNAAGSATTDTVVLTVLYQIIEGANGSWNQNTDEGSLKIRGNGEYSKFQNVKVDGNIIDSKNYTVSEGSTIIELHADYLKTLSEGSHTFEIVWTDGAAGTSFTVVRNTSGSNSTGSNNTGNNDNNDSTDNSAAAAPTAAATAQELDKVPATGDASGIWIALFVVSAVGLAVMLIRRKKQ